jgi:RHS repeat-associated protein
LDQQAAIISYEEYHPYGTAAYRAINREIKATSKRYRYTGKERDEETGLHYFGNRYLACWLGRWVSADPKSIEAGINLYRYVNSNPIAFVDVAGTETSLWQDAKEGSQFLNEQLNTFADWVGQKQLDESRERIETWGLKGNWAEAERISGGIGAAISSTIIKFAGGFVLLGPNLILLPGAVAAVPEQLGYGASEMWDAGLDDPARSAMGFSYIAGGLGTVASLFLMGRGAAKRVGALGDFSAGVSEGVASYAKEVQQPSAPSPKAGPVEPTAPAPASAPVAPTVPPTVSLIQRMAQIVKQKADILNKAWREMDTQTLKDLGATDGQIKQFFEGSVNKKGKVQSYYSNAFGQLLERMVKEAIEADPELDAALEHTGERVTMERITAEGELETGKPDWTGRAGGPLEGLFFDLTTFEGLAEHYERFYGENLVIFIYERAIPTWQAMTQ